ncbi:MAG: 16S rRNA (adenine(1518)-N(6)/adenine(1519)-N(6))-dimethyltransferase RsmA [Bacilli bacterium]
MIIDEKNIKEIIKEIGIVPSKDYGQNFLVVPSICQKIVDLLNVDKEDNVLEVGPGLGSLTHHLFLEEGNIDVIDIDINMYTFLTLYYKDKRDHILFNDVRKIDISKYNKIISNLPYNITSELILYFLINGDNLTSLVLMSELETSEHFLATKGKEYGPLSVLIHCLGKIERKFNVSNSSFYPIPKCKSTVFKIEILNKYDKDFKNEYYRFVKSLFLLRRKTILNNLINLLKDKEKATKLLEASHIMSNRRPEEISPEEYLILFNNYKNIN